MSSSRRESRFVANPFADYDGNESMLSSSNRSLLREDIAQTIMDGAFTLFNYWEEHSRGEYNGNDVSVYTGVTGDALLYLKLAESPPHITSCSSTALLERAINRVNEAMKRMRSKANPIPSFICGEVGLLAVAALAAHKQLQDNSFVDRYLRTIAKERAAVVDLEGAAKELPDELLYGRAGYLYTLLFLRKELSELPSTSTIISDELIRSVVMAILNSGIRTARKHPEIGSPLVYFWHDSQYVGAAHGYTGIAYLLLEAKAHLTEIELNGLVRPMIDFICRLRFPETGNFPSSFGEDKTDKLVHWCHGSPGVIHLLGLASKTFPDGQNYLEIAIQGGNDIWRRGLLKKGYGLCHGATGNAYAFLRLFQLTGDQLWLYRATKFAEWSSVQYGNHRGLGVRAAADRPLSFFEGIAGSIYFLADIIRPKEACFPAFQLSN